jgi:hypothetical protein
VTVALCKGCTRPTGDQAYLCLGCTHQLVKVLAEAPALAVELETTRRRQSRTGGQGSGVVTRSTVRPLPWDENASQAADLLQSTLVAWAKLVHEERGQ